MPTEDGILTHLALVHGIQRLLLGCCRGCVRDVDALDARAVAMSLLWPCVFARKAPAYGFKNVE